MIIKDVIENYLTELGSITRYSNNTIRAYRNDLEEFLKYCDDYNKFKISEISERFIKSYLMILNEKNLDKKSISRKLAAIRSLFKYAYQKDMVEINPKFDQTGQTAIIGCEILFNFLAFGFNKI